MGALLLGTSSCLPALMVSLTFFFQQRALFQTWFSLKLVELSFSVHVKKGVNFHGHSQAAGFNAIFWLPEWPPSPASFFSWALLTFWFQIFQVTSVCGCMIMRTSGIKKIREGRESPLQPWGKCLAFSYLEAPLLAFMPQTREPERNYAEKNPPSGRPWVRCPCTHVL